MRTGSIFSSENVSLDMFRTSFEDKSMKKRKKKYSNQYKTCQSPFDKSKLAHYSKTLQKKKF